MPLTGESTLTEFYSLIKHENNIGTLPGRFERLGMIWNVSQLLKFAIKDLKSKPL